MKTFPLSTSQQSVWLHQKINASCNAYNIPVYFRIDSKVDTCIIKESIKNIIGKYEIFGVKIHEEEGQPYQTICDYKENIKVDVFQIKESIAAELKEYVSNAFNISEYPLFRIAIVQNQKSEKYILLVFHHLISDGTSLYLLANEIRQRINDNKNETLVENNQQFIEYCDFVSSELPKLSSGEKAIHKKYWLEKLGGNLTYLSLSYDFDYNINDRRSASNSLIIDDSLREKIEYIARKSNSSLYCVLFTGFILLLNRLTGEQDIIIGSPIMNRDKQTARSQGLFLNTIMLRNQVRIYDTVSKLLEQVKSSLFQALRHRDYPFSCIISDLKINSNSDKFPLSNILFNGLTFFENGLNDEAFEAFSNDFGLDINFDLDCYVAYSKNNLQVRLDYRRALFKEDTIKLYLEKYLKILAKICDQYDQPISSINYNTSIIPVKLDQDALWYKSDVSLVEVFYRQATKYAQNIAVKTQEYSITYLELNEITNRWANYILNNINDARIGICVTHNQNLAISVLAILKSGKSYIPLDIAYPDSRKIILLNEAKTSFVIVDNKTNNLFSNLQGINLVNISEGLSIKENSENLDISIDTDSEAYVLFTSGSTGKPKGVIQLHKNVIHFISQYTSTIGITERDKLSGFSSITYDSFNNDFYGAILNGATYSPLSLKENEKDLGEWVNENGITIWHSVPGVFRMCAQEWIYNNKCFDCLRIIKMTGDIVRLFDFESFKKVSDRNARFVISIGSTESTLTCINLFGHDDIYGRQTMPVGFAIARTNVYILNNNGDELDILEPGEIVVESDFLTPGYFNNYELDKNIFYRKQGRRFYRTGDMGRKLADGRIEWISRKDFQIKINGIRIEPGEIENYLISYKGINEVIVVMKNSSKGEKYLCAYIIANDKINIHDCRDFLSKSLPDYMLPSYFMQLDRMPLTSNGKIDRKNLPEPEIKKGNDFTLPTNITEEILVNIWSEVLKIDKNKISTTSNFFELGGNSLNATILVNKIFKKLDVEVPLKEVFKHTNINGLSKFIQCIKKPGYIPIVKATLKEYYKLSSAQKRLYFLYEFNKKSLAYNMPQVLKLEGNIESERINKTFNKLIARHEILRSSFEIINNEVQQKISPHINFEIEYFTSSEDEVKSIIGNFIRPFDLGKTPLIRAGLIRILPHMYILMVDMHHIITDGTSQGILIKDFMALYNDEELLDLELQYKDYAEWQQGREFEKNIIKQKEFWLNEFSEESSVLDIPTDFVRPSIKSHQGITINFNIGSEETSQLKALAKTEETTLFMVLLSVYNIFLARISNQEDIIIGTPIAGRQHADLEDMIGMFVNTLPLRNYPKGELNYKDFLSELKSRTLEYFDNQWYQYEELIHELKIERNASRNPLFDTMLVFQNFEQSNFEIPGLTLSHYTNERAVSKLDITLSAAETNGQILMKFTYSTELFKEDTIERFIAYFKKIVSTIIYNINIKISDIDIISVQEKHKLLQEFNDTKFNYPYEKTIISLFEEQVERTPDKYAIIYEGNKITFNELNARSADIAFKLNEISRKSGIAAIYVEPSIEMVVGILGILKSGLVFLPLDPAQHSNRQENILQDSCCDILLTKEHLKNALNFSGPKIIIDHKIKVNKLLSQRSKIQHTDLVYIIYTSGSTGKPKGVKISNNNLVNYYTWFKRISAFNSEDKVLLTTSYAFDAIYTQFFASLLTGAELHVIPREKYLSPEKLIEYIDKEGITFLKMTPTLFNMVVNNAGFNDCSFPEVRLIMLGGEAINTTDVSIAMTILPHVKYINHYGPTETTIGSIAGYINPENVICFIERPTIGKPIDNTKCYIIGKYSELLPLGCKGELYICGEGVGKGYVGQKELTNERFIKNPFVPGERMYRTGDLARWQPDGNIEFIGRIDNQVKIRGYRIEPGEIRSHLVSHEKIKESTVVITEINDDKYLVAYYISEEKLEGTELRSFLSKKLPDYMLPSYFVRLDEMPLTPNGKINRKALPEPEIKKGDDHTPPKNEIEEKLVEIWSEVLKIEKDKISTTSNFFELGGNSLKAMYLISIINKTFNTDIELQTLFEEKNIQNIAGTLLCCQKQNNSSNSIYHPVKALKKDYYTATPALKAMYFYTLRDRLKYNNLSVFIINGKIDIEKFHDCLVLLINRHEFLRTSFHQINGELIFKINDDRNDYIEMIKCSRNETYKRISVFNQPFELDKHPLFKIAIIEISANEYYFLFLINHLIYDGESLSIFIRELVSLYNGNKLPALEYQYKDYAAWFNNLAGAGLIKQQEYYFIDKAKYFTPTYLPYNKVKILFPQKWNYEIVKLDMTDVNSVNTFCGKHGVTKFTFFLTVFELLLSNELNKTDISIGLYTTGRKLFEFNNIFGCFNNKIIFRTQIQKCQFVEQLKLIDKEVRKALNNSLVPFEEITSRIIELNNYKFHNPAPIRFNYTISEPINSFSDFEIKPFKTKLIKANKSKFTVDIYLEVQQTDNDIKLSLSYNNNRYKKSRMKGLMGDYLKIIREHT